MSLTPKLKLLSKTFTRSKRKFNSEFKKWSLSFTSWFAERSLRTRTKTFSLITRGQISRADTWRTSWSGSTTAETSSCLSTRRISKPRPKVLMASCFTIRVSTLNWFTTHSCKTLSSISFSQIQWMTTYANFTESQNSTSRRQQTSCSKESKRQWSMS